MPIQRAELPLLLGIDFGYTEEGVVIATINYMEEREKTEHATITRTLTFSNKIAEHVEEAVDDVQMALVRIIDAVNEEMRERPASIPSRKAQVSE